MEKTAEQKKEEQIEFCHNALLNYYVQDCLKGNVDTLPVLFEHLETTYNDDFVKNVISVADELKSRIQKKKV